MAVNSSAEYDKQVSVLRDGSPHQLQLAPFNITENTASTGTSNLCVLPPGKLIVYSHLSYLKHSNMVAGANTTIGYAAYTAENGTAVAANVNQFQTIIASGGGAVANTMAGINMEGFQVNTMYGLTVQRVISSSNTVVNGTFQGAIAYVRV
jgi:hypothetical protein